MKRRLLWVPCLVLLGCIEEPGNSTMADLNTPKLVFRRPDGKEITATDLATEERARWELTDEPGVPVSARELHARARQAGERGDFDSALKDLAEANRLAPKWPYPVYDMAWTYLLKGDQEKAEEYYAKVLQLSPRGFFTAITAADCLRREREGELPKGLYKSLVALEWMSDDEERRMLLKGIVDKFPSFAPAWSQLGDLTEDDGGRLTILNKGLAASPDVETKAMLLINKALLFSRQGKKDEAVTILEALALDPGSPIGVEHLARFALSQLATK